MNGNTYTSTLIQNPNQKEIQFEQILTGISADENYEQNQFGTNQNLQIFDVPIYESSSNCNSEKVLIDKINNKIISFYSTFKFLKFKYHIKNTRRNQIDCLIKKIKTKFHNSLHLILKNCLNIYINRLPQFFVTNAKIDFNKLYLNKTIDEIYTEYKILPSLEEIMEKKIYRKNQNEFVKVLFRSKLKNVYQAYLLSQLYKKHINYIQKKEGVNFAKLYNFVSKYVLDYYFCNKGNKRRQSDKQKITRNNNSTDKNKNVNKNKVENGIVDNIIHHNFKNIKNDNDKKKFNITKNNNMFITTKY